VTDTRPLVAVLDYGIGNLRSAEKGLQRAGADARLTDDRGLIVDADAVVMPGVGAFAACMSALRGSGLADVALESIDSGRPFLGICVGMQMLYEGSDENPGTPGLGVLPGHIHLLPDSVRRPQMQWNLLRVVGDAPVLAGLDGAWMYFVHSYAAEAGPDVVAVCDYGGDITAAVMRRNLFATQFHPEKSGRNGLALLANFVASVARTPA
jgi:imidazole glycerol-phosphate synthase subunit HisH